MYHLRGVTYVYTHVIHTGIGTYIERKTKRQRGWDREKRREKKERERERFPW